MTNKRPQPLNMPICPKCKQKHHPYNHVCTEAKVCPKCKSYKLLISTDGVIYCPYCNIIVN